MLSSEANPRSARITVALTLGLVAFYTLTRGPNLGRELSYEESIFLTPGLRVLNGEPFSWDWGTLVPNASAFHKPPLLSLLLGLFANLGPDPVTAARLVPFICGFIGVFVVAWLTRSILACSVLLISPLCFAASAHLQTDGTVGILGYSLVSAGVICFFDRRAFAWPLIASGLFVLWLGKLEIAVFATVIILVLTLSGRSDETLKQVARLAGVTAAGIALLALLCYLLNSTTKSTFASAWSELTGTVSRITKSSIQAQAAAPVGLGPGRRALIAAMGNYSGWYTLSAFLMPTAILLGANRMRAAEEWRKLGLLFLAGAIPFFTYLAVGFPGDGFPRYFTWPLVPLALLLGCAWKINNRLLPRIAATALACIFLIPAARTTVQLAESQAHPAAPRREFGYRDAAVLLRALIRPGCAVVAPEPSAFYLEGYPVYVQESFEPYPNRQETIRAIISEFEGAIILANPAPTGITKEILDSLISRNAVVQQIGSFAVYAIPSSQSRSPAITP